jgi:site-specific DNA-cytosine methylase
MWRNSFGNKGIYSGRDRIRKLYVCGISDSEARTLVAARLEVLSKMFQKLSIAHNGSCPLFLCPPARYCNNQVEAGRELGPVDFIIHGFPCQGFYRAARRAQRLQNIRSAMFFLTW